MCGKAQRMLPRVSMRNMSSSHSRYQYSVMMGDRNLQGILSGLVVPVSRVVVHPQFSTSGTIKNDLALLRLRYPVNFTGVIQPICIPEKTFHVQAGTRCWVTGWGRKQEFGETVRKVVTWVEGGSLIPGVSNNTKVVGWEEADHLAGG